MPGSERIFPDLIEHSGANLQKGESRESDKKTQQAIEDWHYWVDSGYEF